MVNITVLSALFRVLRVVGAHFTLLIGNSKVLGTNFSFLRTNFTLRNAYFTLLSD